MTTISLDLFQRNADEQEIELPPIRGKVDAEIVDIANRPQHYAHAATGHRARSVTLFKVRHGGQMIRVRVDVDHVNNRDTPFTPLPPLKATEKLRPAVYDRVSGCSPSPETFKLPFS